MGVTLVIILCLCFTIPLLKVGERRMERRSAGERLAARRGLRYVSGFPPALPRLVGQVGAYPVEVRSRGMSGTVTVHSRLPLPLGLQITRVRDGMRGVVGGAALFPAEPLLGRKLVLRSREPSELAVLFSDPVLQRACWSLVSWGGQVRDGLVELWFRGEADETVLSAMLDDALALAVALDGASVGLWRQRGREAGLSLHEGEGVLSLHGQAAGVNVAVYIEPRGLVLRAIIPSPLAQDLRIWAGQGRLRLGDPVLDGAIAVETPDPERVRAALRDDGLRTDLLAVIHGYTGSTVEDNAVWMRVPLARATDLPTLVAEAAGLAAGLGRRLASAQGAVQ